MLIKLRKLLRGKKAQGTAEYAILIGLAVGAVVVMQTYIKRGIQGKIKDSTDLLTSAGGIINDVTLGTTKQYEPYYLVREQEQTLSKDRSEKRVTAGGDAATSSEKDITHKSAVVSLSHEKQANIDQDSDNK